MANWRDEYQVNVGWVGKPELGFLSCEVVETWADAPGRTQEPHPVKTVRWANGKPARVVYMHGNETYVFAPKGMR